MLPPETIFAVFPPEVEVGGIKLQAPTLYHVCGLEALGVDLNEPITPENCYIALYVLHLAAWRVAEIISSDGDLNKSGFAEFVRTCSIPIPEIIKGVNRCLALAHSTSLRPKEKGGHKKTTFIEDGLGWVLEAGELYAAEYGVDPGEAFAVPLVRLYACIAAARQRHGIGNQDSYMLRAGRKERVERLKKMNANQN